VIKLDEHQQSYNILFVYKINKALITRPIKIKEKNNININNICFFQSSIHTLTTNMCENEFK
jgi:hypothetical protein